MTLLARLRSFMAVLVASRRLEREMDEEWRFHVEARADALLAEGFPPDEAVRRARAEFGDPLRWKESSREARGVIWIYDLVTDLGYGLRQLRRAPVFAVTVIVTLALGIGANTLAFSILHAVLVRELPWTYSRPVSHANSPGPTKDGASVSSPSMTHTPGALAGRF